MNIVRVSLFCVAALLVNGAYAKDFSGSAGAIAKTAEFTLSNSPVWESRVAAQQDGSAELSAQPTRAVGAIGDDAQWLRISDDGETGTANREPRPANSTPRWVF
ncbi:hypothetical protein EGJ23_16800 [Pseudomonas sp. o96-267]|uniref:hypothetical protein n=1 Tax=Pseudomonas sp. o96-267 TaxID=2479853 RepID=UPI000F7699FE|nr:hypothetical protein [Pseudomonas sp. o96-267]RRV25075.1 hypothetical protein EGJ23_16800 [Pseudomonas sp. o96-267]